MKINKIIRKWRVMSELPVREVAKEIGISPATFSRFERGEDTTGETLAAIMRWLLSKES